MEYITVKPFIKWAGGKSQLLNEIRAKYPQKPDKYCEPFVGGGAVLLDVLANLQPKEVLINDINEELINTYLQIKNDVEELIVILSSMQEKFWAKNNDERKVMYLAKRERFNNLKENDSEQDNLEKAALFIFLNKTCFNGLYRVNSKGMFNVPMGSYKNPPICDEDNLRLISRLLKKVQIKCGDYSECAEFINENTFVYIDPPYRPLTATASFTSYSENEFGDKQQIELGSFIDIISAKGAKVVASNSDPKNSNENDNFFDDLYSNYTIMRVSAKRMLNRDIIGVDINDAALERCREKIDFDYEPANGKVYIKKGDARNLNFIPDESIDLICTHPPYADIIKYSDGIDGDLSQLKVKDFLEQMKPVAKECCRVLKKGKFCAVLMGDTRQKGCMIPMSFEVMKIFLDAGFTLKELIIKEQHNCKATGYWKTNSVKYNFLLIAHEYLFIFKK